MRYVIIGAGAIGGTIGGRLAESGHEVVLVARGAHLDALREGGLRLATPDGTRTHRLPVASGPEEVELRAGDVLVLAVKSQDTVAALDAWAPRPVAGAAYPDAVAAEVLPLLCAQNGVANERAALRRFARVYGVCVWLPSTFLAPGAISAEAAPLSGMLHIGRYPGGVDETAEKIAADLEASHFAAPVTDSVMRWKYAKLLDNLGNAVDAVCGPLHGPQGRHRDPQVAELLLRVRVEGERALAAAGIDWTPREEQRARRGNLVDVVPVPGAERVGSSSWQSLARGTGSVEADWLNGEIVLLGREHGVPTPVNEAVRLAANSLARQGRPPGSMDPRELAARIRGSAAR